MKISGHGLRSFFEIRQTFAPESSGAPGFSLRHEKIESSLTFKPQTMTENTPDGPAPRREDYPDWNSWLALSKNWAMDSLARTGEIMRENEKSMRENAQQLQWLDYMRRIREWITWIKPSTLSIRRRY